MSNVIETNLSWRVALDRQFNPFNPVTPLVKKLIRRYKGVHLDSEEAMKLIDARMEELRSDPEKAQLYSDPAEFEKKRDEKILGVNRIITQKCASFTRRSPFGGRLDSPFTNLSASIRKIIKFKEKKKLIDAAEIDIRSAQPAFLYKILLDMFPNPPGSLIEDMAKFKKLLETDLNDFFAQKLSVSRSEAKFMFISWMFAKVDDPTKQKFRGMMNDEFPAISLLVDKIKSGSPFYINGLTELQEPHKKLAHLLQKAESTFMIDNFSILIMDKFPKSSFFTVHDSIVVPENIANEVQSLLNASLQADKIPTIATRKD